VRIEVDVQPQEPFVHVEELFVERLELGEDL